MSTSRRGLRSANTLNHGAQDGACRKPDEDDDADGTRPAGVVRVETATAIADARLARFNAALGQQEPAKTCAPFATSANSRVVSWEASGQVHGGEHRSSPGLVSARAGREDFRERCRPMGSAVEALPTRTEGAHHVGRRARAEAQGARRGRAGRRRLHIYQGSRTLPRPTRSGSASASCTRTPTGTSSGASASRNVCLVRRPRPRVRRGRSRGRGRQASDASGVRRAWSEEQVVGPGELRRGPVVASCPGGVSNATVAETRSGCSSSAGLDLLEQVGADAELAAEGRPGRR